MSDSGESHVQDALNKICHAAYAGFGHPAVVPLVQLETHLFTQELFHGPTLAFKDMAMQVLALLFEHVLQERNARITIVGATSGDTGSAAIEACAGRERIDMVILHPHQRTSEVQRRQMTTVLAPNVGNVAIEGSFDDCQELVKALFADVPFRSELHLSAVNSINWARIAAQIPYYVAACRWRWAHPSGRSGLPFRPAISAISPRGGRCADEVAGGAADALIELQRHSVPISGK